MNLTVFSSETLPKQVGGGHPRAPRIAFSAAGVIILNKSAQELMGISETDTISLAQDEDAQWYIFKDKDGYPTRFNTDKRSLVFNHRGLKDLFCESVSKDPAVGNRFLIAGQPTVFGKVKYWGILIG